MRSTRLAIVWLGLALFGAGCTVLVDGTLAGRTGTDASIELDASMDDAGPPAGACTGMADGLRCAPMGIVEPFVCIDEVCQLSRCGDGIQDDRDGSMHDPEICDDGNATSGDGCELDCTFSCEHDLDCSDGEICTGDENCQSATHACEPASIATDGTPCTITGTSEMAACRGGICRAGVCPDGILDSGEDCDPAAPAPDDGCEDDCTFTCTVDTDCQNGNACDGTETCTAAHVCIPGTAPACDDMDPCTSDACDPDVGCTSTSVLVDGDGDGAYAITGACGGDDCDDANALAYPGATEACGATADLNCDGAAGVTPTYYLDCDRDGFAPAGATTMMSCTLPPAPSACAAGTWTTRAPVGAGAIDCLDSNFTARPTQTSWYATSASGLVPAYDWNCSGAAQTQYPYGRFVLVSECDFNRDGDCVGSAYWTSTTMPACGGTSSLSSCHFTDRTFPYVDTCTRSTTTATVYCH
jgi:cysteine-rich repeat protein